MLNKKQQELADRIFENCEPSVIKLCEEIRTLCKEGQEIGADAIINGVIRTLKYAKKLSPKKGRIEEIIKEVIEEENDEETEYTEEEVKQMLEEDIDKAIADSNYSEKIAEVFESKKIYQKYFLNTSLELTDK